MTPAVRPPTRWLFSFSFVDRYAAQLTDQLKAAGLAPASKKKVAAKRAEKTDLAFRQMIASARRFQQRERLTFFQRARFAQQVQNRLISLGHSVELSREVAAAISTATAGSSTNPS